jgi:hypothetical protein
MCTPNYVAETFRRRKDGDEWALEMERNIDRNASSKPRALRKVRTFGDLIDLHDQDMRGVGKPPRRSKAAVHGIEISAEEVRLARIALSHVSFVGRGIERDRHPTQGLCREFQSRGRGSGAPKKSLRPDRLALFDRFSERIHE